MMDLTTAQCILARLEYTAVRLPIAFLDDCILAHYWDEDAPPRSDVRHFLGSLDEFAGWLLADDEIARRGETLRRRTRAPGPSEAPVAPDQGQEGGSAAPAGIVDVAFTLPPDMDAGRVALCGDFNDWSAEANPLVRGDDGGWQVSIPLEPGRSYRYRYLLDGERWENGPQADRYEPNPYGGVDSVVVVE